KLSEPFLCFVGIIRYYDLDENYYPTFWADDDEEMDLFAFINHADPTKVQIGEREVREEEGDHVVQIGGIDIMADDEAQAIVAGKPKKVRKKRKVADGASGFSLPPQKLRKDYGTPGDVGASTIGKSLAALQGLLDSSTLSVEVGVTAIATIPFVTSSVTPTPKREDGRHANSITRTNLRNQPAAERFVVLSDSSHHSSTNAADDEVTFIARSSIPPPPILTMAVETTVIADATSSPVPKAGTEPVPHSIFRDYASTGEANQDVAGPSHPAGTELSTNLFFVSQDVDSETLHQIYIPKWNVTKDFALDEPDLCRGVINHLSPLDLFSQLRSMDYEQLFVEFNVGAARQTCLSFEVRLRLEHELREAEAVEAIRLRGQIATIEAAEAAWLDLSNLQLSYDELSIKASSLEFEKDKLVDQVSKLEGTCSELHDEVSGYKLFKKQIKAVHDVQVKVLSDRVAELDANLIGMAVHLDKEFYPHFLTTIAGQRWILNRGLGLMGWLVASIDHGKAGRGLTDVAAYDPSVEANYLSVMSALRAMNFPILSQLESHKDANIADIMGLLHLEGSAADVTPRQGGNARRDKKGNYHNTLASIRETKTCIKYKV
ncbi:hypothetical protein Tco_0335715, partial [Tanacetum coccineum]